MKQRRIEDKVYLKWIRTQPCCHCLHPETVAHHAIGFDGGMGTKAGDHFAVPLCQTCHNQLHLAWMKDDKDGTIRVQMKWVHDMQARYRNGNS